MDFGFAVRYLDQCLVFGIKPSLVRIEKILKLMGNPHNDTDFIHIVGTNGKTSTTRMAAAILQGQGKRCGYHISPHIHSYTERFGYQGREVTEEEFAGLFNLVYPYVQEVNNLDMDGPMTQFEIITAMGFLMARQMELEVMVLEAGMGGRWDATNSVGSVVVGLTGVSLEHTQILGRTVEEIATEKVQVIKKGARVATISEGDEVRRVLEERTVSQKAQLYAIGDDFCFEACQDKQFGGWLVNMKGLKGSYDQVRLSLRGEYQVKNMALAVAVSELYLGGRLDAAKLKHSLAGIKVKGRFEIIRKNPTVIADASHNPEGIGWFCRNLTEYYPRNKKIIIFAVLKDKDYGKMAEQIIGVADTLILTSSQNERSLDIDLLEHTVLSLIKSKNRPLEVYKIDNIANSLNFALKISCLGAIICITGSITNLEHI